MKFVLVLLTAMNLLPGSTYANCIDTIKKDFKTNYPDINDEKTT